VKQLSCTITETMPDFFLLAGDISSGKFSKAAAATSLSNSVYASSGDSENDGQKVTSLLSGIVVGFCKYIRSVVFPRNSKYHRELDSGVSSYMSQKQPQTEEEKKKSRGYHALPASTQGTVNAVLTCYQKIKRLPGFPETCMLSYGRLANDLIAYYTNRIFINGVHAISNLSIKETWRQVPQPKGVTLLPGQFQTHCEKLLVDLECIPDAFWQDPKLLSMIAAPFLECLRAFGDCMHYVGLHTSNLQNHDSALKAQHLDTSAQKLSPFTRDIRAYRLLIVISNIVHTSEVVLPKIWAAFLRRIPRSTDRHLLEDKFQDILDVYEVLESLFVKRYVRVKTMLVGKVIKAGFFKAGTDWASHPTARDLGTGYIQEALMHLVHVHDEVQTVVPDQTGRILDDLTEGVLSTFHQCTIEIKALTTSGAIQLSVQLDFLKETLAAYLSGEAEATIETLEDHFGVIMADLSSGDRKMAVKRSRKILHDVRKITFLLLSCFQEAAQAEEDQ
jgi:hypothetical protein